MDSLYSTNSRFSSRVNSTVSSNNDDFQRQIDQVLSEKQAAVDERDQALEDLTNVESAFSHLHQKYERAKNTLENLKRNEDILKLRDDQMQKKLENSIKKMEALQKAVDESMLKQQSDYDEKLQEVDGEMMRLRANMKRAEMRISTLENDLEQKRKENSQLNSLCEELIHGTSN